MPEDLIITGRRVLIDGELRPATLTIRDGRIHHIDSSQPSASDRVIDAGDLAVLPGLVDTHVHVNEPGRTDWEGFETAGRAAAAGGITTIVVMPLNCTPAATNVAALMGEAEAATGKCLVDFGLWGGIVPGNADQIEPMWEAGALGFKAFMVDSGVEDYPGSSMSTLRVAALILERLSAPLLIHAEDPEVIREALPTSGLTSNPRSYSKYMASRPAKAEIEAARQLFGLLTEHPRMQLHIVHIAAREPVALLPLGKSMGYSMTGETCPHYLFFDSEHIPDGSTIHKCAPPIRESGVQTYLWSRLENGYIDLIASDHSPCPPELKCLDTGDFSKAWGGISSLQLSLSATWTGAHARGFSLTDIARWMSENPAKLAGIADQKGRIARGLDADLIFFDPDAEWTVRAADLYHRHKLTPYDGRLLRGAVRRTILRGTTVFDADQHPPFPPSPTEPIGQWIKRGTR